MPVETHVLPRLNLAIFAYSGQVQFAEAQRAVAEVSTHPDHHDTMRQLCDLSAVTGVERDFPELMKTQARMAEHLLPKRGERLVVFYAPHPIAQTMAEMARKSWDGFDEVLVRIVAHEDQAIALLGVKQSSIAEMVQIGA